MFERYTEKARRTIFFARYETSMLGGAYIETEHLLLGLLREDKALANQILGSYLKIEAIRHSIAQSGAKGDKVATSVDLPLSHESKRVLAYGAEEAERLNHQHIGTPHLLLGLLREEKCLAAALLREQGVTLAGVREYARGSEPPRTPPGAVSIAGLYRWITELEAREGIWSAERDGTGNRKADFAIYAGDPPKEGEWEDLLSRVPFLCIEVMRDDRFWEVRKRCDEYMAGGVAEVWLLDPSSKRAYTVTQAEGLREFQGVILRIVNPPLEMDLGRIFE